MKSKIKVWFSIVLIAVFVLSALSMANIVGLSGPVGAQHQAATGASINDNAPLAQVAGPAPATVANATIGDYSVVSEPFNASAVLTVTVGLKQSSAASSFVQSLNNPASAYYRQYITAQEYGSMFGVNPSVYGSIANYFESYGLTVTPNAGLISMQVTGTVTQMEQAFHTVLGAYATQLTSTGFYTPGFGNASAEPGHVSTSTPFYMNTAGLDLPSSIASYVSGIVGLSGLQATPQVAMPKDVGPGVVYGNTHNLSSLLNFTPTSQESVTSYAVQGINNADYVWVPGPDMSALSSQITGNFQILFPSTMHVVTGAENLWNGNNTIASEPDLGQGITVALIEVGFANPVTLQEFSQQVFNNSNQILDRTTFIGVGQPGFGLPPTNFQSWYITGLLYGWQVETDLDIEYLATMAPDAHIDVIGVGSADFSSFDQAYAAVAQYLSTGTAGATPAGLYAFNGAGNYVTSLTSAAASISITSNSYGAGEIETALYGAPMYITVENELLDEMNAVGVTNFFASGDSSGAVSSDAANTAGMPASSTGSTSVGGGQVTAYGTNGQKFPVTSNYIILGYEYEYVPFPPYQCVIPIPGYVVPAQGLASFQYWSYSEGLGGTYTGIAGGGFGQSIMETQPWYQNALDTYSTGAMIDPVISGPAAFNMSIWVGPDDGNTWLFLYGGTSFATPTSAGEWALIEEQVNTAFGSPKMGNINPLLYAVHNANEAGVSSVSVDPFTDMINGGYTYDAAPVNSYNWYYYNLSINEPGDPLLPWWFNTIYNPAGPGWNYLQGLGMMNAGLMDNVLVGQTLSTQHSLLNEPFVIMQVTSSGLQDITTLQSGVNYTFQVVLSNGQVGGYYNVQAYSDNPNDGSYGGGMMTTLQTNASGMFSYTPMYNSATPAGSDYGFFLATSVSSSDWSFAPFAVVQPDLTSGNLTIGVVNPYGQLETSVAEIPMFTTLQTGYYNYWGIGPADVMLNGAPVTDAVVTETSVNVSQVSGVTLPVSTYAPGVVLGSFLTDQRGNTVFWTDAHLAEVNGSLYTQVVTLQASYRGLTSNVVTVYIEPQAGTFFPSVSLNTAGTALTGFVQFNGMTNVNYVNVSIGSMPGQYVNVSYPGVYYDSQSGLMMSGVGNGIIPVNFTVLPPPGTPIVLNMVAQGANDLSLTYSFFGFSFVTYDVQNPIVWSDPITITNPGPAPTALLMHSGPAVVNGTVSFDYAGSWQASGAVGYLNISYGTTVKQLAVMSILTGTYALNTSAFADGFYTLTYTVVTPTGLHASSSVTIYTDNTEAQLNAEIVTLQNELKSADALISSLQTELASDNATIATMQAQINSLQAQVGNLTTQLKAEMAQYNTTESELISVESSLSANAALITSLKAEISSDNSTIASQNAQVNSLKGEVATLQNELNNKKYTVAAGWYDIFGGFGAAILVVIIAISMMAGYFISISRRKRDSRKHEEHPASGE